jgi:hypothetical protein
MDQTHDALFLNWFVGGWTRFGDRAEFKANELLPTVRHRSPFTSQQAHDLEIIKFPRKQKNLTGNNSKLNLIFFQIFITISNGARFANHLRHWIFKKCNKCGRIQLIMRQSF